MKKIKFRKTITILTLFLSFILILFSCDNEKELEEIINTTNSQLETKAKFLRGDNVPKGILEFIKKSTVGTNKVYLGNYESIKFLDADTKDNDTFGIVDDSKTITITYENEKRYTFNVLPTNSTNTNDVVNLIVIETGLETTEYFVRYSFDNITQVSTYPTGAVDMSTFSGKIYYYDNIGNLTGEYEVENGVTTSATGYSTPCPNDGTNDDTNTGGTGTGGGGSGGGNLPGDGTDPSDGGSGGTGGGELTDPDTCGFEWNYEQCGCGGDANGHPPQEGVPCCQGSPLVVTNTCTGDSWTTRTNNFTTDCPSIDGVIIDLELSLFINSLDSEQLAWWITPVNQKEVEKLKLFLEAESYSDSAKSFARSVINLFKDTSLTDQERYLGFITIYDVFDPPLDINSSVADFEERIRKYAHEFRRRGQEEFAQYLESIIPFEPTTTIGEILDLFEVIRTENLRLFYKYLIEVTIAYVVSFEPVIKLALFVVAGRFGLQLLQSLPSIHVTAQIANIIYRLRIPSSVAFTTFQHAKKFGIQTYTQLQQEFAALGTTASQMSVHRHHLIEQRFANVPGVSEWLGASTSNWKCIVLTYDEHQVFTNAWRQAISTNFMNNPGWTNTFTHNATLEDVKAAAMQIYADYPEILEALGL